MQCGGREYVIAVDIGGTCTDVALVDVRTKQHVHGARMWMLRAKGVVQ
jgi:N-methylhydantoinase A/oxoprolinase/acetone carboxylase beta subunit